MCHRIRPLVAILFLIALLAMLGPGEDTAASDLAARYTGIGQIDGRFLLEIAVSPAVSLPGQTLTLELGLTNSQELDSSPSIFVGLPGGLTLDRNRLPSGTTLNLQTGELNWLPLVAAGETQRVSASLWVETADIARPEQEIVVTLRDAEDEQQVAVPIWIGIPPQINQIVSAPQVAVGQPIQLRAELGGSGPFMQTWDLGDGRRLTVPDPEVVYPAPGIYQLTLSAENALSASAAMKSLTVVPHPAAQFEVDDAMPGVGQVVSFLSESGGLPPLTYAWDFGDGATADAASPTHQYDSVGTYQVQLVVQNAYGQSEGFWSVTVGTPPGAEMNLPDTVASGVPVTGRATGDESVSTFLWDMGDGHAYQGDQISHIYRRSGDYYVSLSAGNDFGSAQLGQWIHVSQGIEQTYLPLLMNNFASPGGVGLIDPLIDPLGILLEPVPLDEPFVMEPLEVPAGTSQAQQLLLAINEARRLFELPPLNHVVQLSVAAQRHTDDMAAYAFTAHVGSDGSFPAERLVWSRYEGGYAGEATAWGFQHPHQAVQFWVNSPAHRRIILNRYATDVGVGFTVKPGAPNVWYWTAEFGSASAPPTIAAVRLDQPLPDPQEAPEDPALLPLITDPLSFSWNWPLPLTEGQRFVVYLIVNGEARPLSLVTDPELGSRYQGQGSPFPTALDYQAEVNDFEWLVALEDEDGRVFAQSESRVIWLAPDPSLPAPTPAASPTPEPTAVTTPTPSPTPLPTSPPPTPTPPIPTPPLLITATPRP